MALHSALTGADLHEPKGAPTATSGSVYISNGAGSGSWLPPPFTLSATIADVSTAETVYLPIPYAGTVTKVVSVLTGSLTTADATVTVRNSAAASMGTLTITQAGSAAGDVDTLSPVANHTVSANSFMTIETNGASDTARKLELVVFITRS